MHPDLIIVDGIMSHMISTLDTSSSKILRFDASKRTRMRILPLCT